VIAAGRRGFSRWRVANALGISARGLTSIEERIEVNARQDGLDGGSAFDAGPALDGVLAQPREHEAGQSEDRGEFDQRCERDRGT
jgi:hypothetical protein